MLAIHSNWMVSLDVMSVPVDKTVGGSKPSGIFGERPSIPIDNLLEILTFFVQIFFQLESDICQKEEGLTVGSPLSLIMENVYGIL